MTYPKIADLPDEIASEVVRELTDSAFASRTHGTRSCHNAGCRGPLCAKFNRDRAREQYRRNNEKLRPRKRNDDNTEITLAQLVEQVRTEGNLAVA